MIKSKKHILVTGPHRSGTTWLGKTVAQHPSVELVHEPFNPEFEGYNFTHQFRWFFEHVPTSPDYQQIKKTFDRYLPTSLLKYPLKICRETKTSVKTPLLFIKYLLLSPRMPRYLLKDPIALMSAGWLHKQYNLDVICITRNPLAFAGSLKKLNWDFDFNHLLKQEELSNTLLRPFKDEMEKMKVKSDFTDRIGLLWNVLNFVILEYQKEYPHWLFVKHEELAANPVDEFKKIFMYLNLEWSDEIQSYIKMSTSSENPGETKGHTFQPRDAGSLLHSWKKRLTEEEADRIRLATEPIYSRLYKESSYIM